MITCMVLDDEQYSIDVLVHHIEQTPFLQLIGTTTQPAEALQWLREKDVQLLFCDIQMPQVSGLDIAKTVKGKTRIIFTTAYSQFALDGYELDVLDYLLKPVSYPRFLAAVQKAATAIASGATVPNDNPENDYVFVKTGTKGKVERITLNEIDYVEGDKNYVSIVHNGRKTLVAGTMKMIESQLPGNRFIRVHKSFLVPIAHITGLEGNRVLLKNVTKDILLGDTYRASFLLLIQKKLIGH